jgi:hypothetical protein
MRDHVHMGLRSRSVVLVALLTVSATVAAGCGSAGALGLQDWQRDVLASLFGLAPGIIPLPVAGPAGATGPAGPAGADGAPGPNIIIARAVINADATIENTDHITVVAHPTAGQYQLNIDTTGQVLPAGTTEDDFEVFVTLKETIGLVNVPYYVPISLVGTTLRIDIFLVNSVTVPADQGFSIQVLLPAG